METERTSERDRPLRLILIVVASILIIPLVLMAVMMPMMDGWRNGDWWRSIDVAGLGNRDDAGIPTDCPWGWIRTLSHAHQAGISSGDPAVEELRVAYARGELSQEEFGGTCLNRGCIPTKTMLRSAEVANLARRSEEFGIDIDGAIEPDIDAIVERKDDIVESIRKGAYENVESNENIDFVEGHGIFESPHEIRVDDRTLSAETIVINTGASDRRGRRSTASTTSTFTTARICWSVPRFPSLAVIGGGYVGCEYAQMYSRFGADVTVFQRGDTLLPDEDPDVSEVIETAFENEEITVQTGTPVTALTETNDGIRVDAGADGTVSVTARTLPSQRAEHRIRTASSLKTSARHWTRTDSSRPTTASERLLTVSTPLAT